MTVWLQDKFNIELSTEVIGMELSPVFHQSLKNSLHDEICQTLQSFLIKNRQEEIDWLKRWDKILWECQGKQDRAIAQMSQDENFPSTEEEVRQRLKGIKEKLCLELKRVYEAELAREGIEVDLNTLPSFPKACHNLVEGWLNDVQLN